MFGNKSNETSGETSFLQNTTMIGKGVNIEGEIIAEGDVRIDGSIKGLVRSKAKVVGPTGSIDGDVFCDNADISGRMTGKIDCSNVLFLKASANITGEFNMGKLVVEMGARMNGTCSMGIKDMKTLDIKEKKVG
jgi:cytoskeletal protein CcmA (bactofilin family)